MSELYEKSLIKLELDQVLEQLAACAGSSEGKAACLALRPVSDLEEVQLFRCCGRFRILGACGSGRQPATR